MLLILLVSLWGLVRVLVPPLVVTLGPTLSLPLPISRADTEAGFGDCPQHCIDLCVRLTAGPLSAEARAKRAWRAGCWAAPLAVKPAVYVVLRSCLGRPARFSSFTALRRVIGEISGSDAVLHSFGSIAEARVYCCGAGVPFPEPLA